MLQLPGSGAQGQSKGMPGKEQEAEAETRGAALSRGVGKGGANG